MPGIREVLSVLAAGVAKRFARMRNLRAISQHPTVSDVAVIVRDADGDCGTASVIS
jgi:hypothetical protein